MTTQGVNLEATLEAGPAGEFMKRVLESPDRKPPQLVNAEDEIEKAVKSGDPALKDWADSMRIALNETAEAEALELSMAQESTNDPTGLQAVFEKFTSRLAEAFAAFKAGDIMGGIKALFNQQADPQLDELNQHRMAAQQALQDGDAYLKGARNNGVDVDGTLGPDAQEDIKTAMDRINAIAPTPSVGK